MNWYGTQEVLIEHDEEPVSQAVEHNTSTTRRDLWGKKETLSLLAVFCV